MNRDLILDTRAFSPRAAVTSLDGVLSVLVLLRLYHAIAWLHAAVLARYTSRRFAARLSHQPAGPLLAARILALHSPLLTAAAVALAAAVVFSYVYRVAESRWRTACDLRVSATPPAKSCAPLYTAASMPPPLYRRLYTAASMPPPLYRRLYTAASMPPPLYRRLYAAASIPPPLCRCLCSAASVPRNCL